MPLAPIAPPRPLNADGDPRRVGVELEFAGLDCAEAAEVIRQRIGGTARAKDPYRIELTGTALGDVAIELDVQAAHPKGGEGKVGGMVRSALGRIAGLVMPNELSAPPIAWDRLEAIDELVEALRRHGARGTEGGLLYAFGLHFNPEVAETGIDYLRDVLRAFVLLEPWLRASIHIDPARDLAPFIERFPAGYAALLADPAYRPNQAGFVEDYLTWNPTRNRSLDLFPLFAWLDPQGFSARVTDKHVRPRPTFHYRLPNSRIGDPGWSIIPDWNRWVEVERLAENKERLNAMGEDYCRRFAGRPPEDWLEETHQWLDR